MNLLEYTIHLAGDLDEMGYPAISSELERIVENIIKTAKKHRKWVKIAGSSSGYRSQARAEIQETLTGLLSGSLAKQAGIWDSVSGAWQGLRAPWEAQKEQAQYVEYRQFVSDFLEKTPVWSEQASFLAQQRDQLIAPDSGATEPQLESLDAQADALKEEVYEAFQDFKQTTQQVLNAAKVPTHPNYFFAQKNLNAVEEAEPTLGQPSYPQEALMSAVKILNNQIVEGHEQARAEYNAAVKDLTKQQNQWQNIGNYSPLMQLLLMSAGENKTREILGRASRGAQQVMTNPRALNAAIQRYSQDKAVLEEVATWMGYNNVEDLLANLQSTAADKTTTAPALGA